MNITATNAAQNLRKWCVFQKQTSSRPAPTVAALKPEKNCQPWPRLGQTNPARAVTPVTAARAVALAEQDNLAAVRRIQNHPKSNVETRKLL